MKTSLLSALICFVSAVVVTAQLIPADSILAQERSIDRPVTVHAGQLRISGEYGLSTITRRFDDDNNAVQLRDDGVANVRHRFTIDIKYGLNDYIQFNTAIAHSSNIVREQPLYILPISPDPAVLHTVLREYRGVEDVYAGVDVRAPLKTRKLDISITMGGWLPVAHSQPRKPQHTFGALQENETTVHRFDYRYRYPQGQGIAIARIGGLVKYRSIRWAVSGRVDYQHALKNGERYEWLHQINDELQFEYRKNFSSYRHPDSFAYFAEGEYQMRPWFDAFLIVSGHTAYRGWYSGEDDVKIAAPYQSSWSLSPGFEIIVTPRLWFRQTLNFAVAGRNYEAPFSIRACVMYNFFPFK